MIPSRRRMDFRIMNEMVIKTVKKYLFYNLKTNNILIVLMKHSFLFTTLFGLYGGFYGEVFQY